MDPTAVEALRQISESISTSNKTIAKNTDALVADQRDARAREKRRFGVVYFALALLAAALALVLLGQHQEAEARADRSRYSEQQRQCSDVIEKDTLGRLTDMASIPRYKVDEHGNTLLDAAGAPVPRDPADVIGDLDRYRRAVVDSNPRLHRIAAICYGPNGPDPTPLDDDPSR